MSVVTVTWLEMQQESVSWRKMRGGLEKVAGVVAGEKTQTRLQLLPPPHHPPAPPLHVRWWWQQRRRHLTPSAQSAWTASTTWHTWTAACIASVSPASRSGHTTRQSVHCASSLLPPSCTRSGLRTTSRSTLCGQHPPTVVSLPLSPWWQRWLRQHGATTR